MEKISNRHEDDLGGYFLPFGETSKIDISVIVSPETASTAAVQHTAWMLVNLLTRFDGVINTIGFICPKKVPLAGRIVPLVLANMDLREAILTGARDIGIVPVVTDVRHPCVIVVGAMINEHIDGNLYVHGEGWWGGASVNTIKGSCHSPLPFGPYVAACIAAGEIFKSARMSKGAYEPITDGFYSTWLHRSTTERTEDWLEEGPLNVDGTDLDIGLAGVGAVGCAFIHALWSTPGIVGHALIADNDAKGLEETNLNRYSLFGKSSLGKSKSAEAARITCGTGIHWHPYDQGFEELDHIPLRVISAVDNNRARMAIQNRYPARILSGSTYRLRAEVLRCGPPGVGACLRCYNPPEKILPDIQVRDRLRMASITDLQSLADEVGIPVEAVNEWIEKGQCGMLGERILPYSRRSDTRTPLFAVAFVSVMAGTLLAAETIKDICAPLSPLSEDLVRAVFQFKRPTARTNAAGKYARDPDCPMCSPEKSATSIWSRRFEALGPSRKTIS